MAAAATVTVSAPGSTSAGEDGPVLSVISRRLRALRKKYNRIVQMEESLAAGKTLNKEQEEVLRSKPGLVAVIDELERLRAPLVAAVAEELAAHVPAVAPAAVDEASVEQFLPLVYFGSLFDVRPQSEFTTTMLTRAHERNVCLTYDCFTEDMTADDLLKEADLDAIALLNSLVSSRPATAGVSHRDALRDCTHRVRLWLSRADEPVQPGATATYAGVRAKLEKIISSDYLTALPEVKATGDVAAAIEQFSGLQMPGSDIGSADTGADGSSAENVHQEEEDVNAAENLSDHQSGAAVDDAGNTDEEVVAADSSADAAALKEHDQVEATAKVTDQRDADPRAQQYVPRRPYPNHQGGTRGGGGGRRGYMNGRGGPRGGGRGGSGYMNGGYQNGRGQYYDPGYYPRNSYNGRGGRGGRSGGLPMHNNYGGQQYVGRPPVGRYELGTSA